MIKLFKSVKFWLLILTLPFALVGCASLFMEMESDFDHDDFVARDRVAVATPEVESLSYLHRGDPMGQRVIFVHGTPGDATAWYDMLKSVPAGYEFVSVDRPGFGRTLPKKAVTSLDAQAAALVPLLHTKSGIKPILVGHSLGGPIVAAAAANYPDLVGGIVIVAGALDPALEDVRFIQYVGDIPPVSWLLGKPLRHTNRELIDLEDELVDLAPRLGGIHIPVAIIHGTRDGLVPYANVAYMEKMFTGTKAMVITLDDFDHFLPWTAPNIILTAAENLTVKADSAR